MKHKEFMRLEEKCPKCQNSLMLQKTSWSNLSGALYYVFCKLCHCKGNGANKKETALENFHKELARKEKLALRKPEKILTDIRDYIMEKKKICDVTFDLEREMFIDTLLADLTEYAEQLGVEL